MKQDLVEALSLWPCNQNVCSNKILFFFGVSLFSCLLLRSNFCFLPCRNSVVCSVSALHMCYYVSVFGVSTGLKKKKKNSSLVSSSTIDSTQVSSLRLQLFFFS